jgi:hypothetical protein
MEINLDHRNLNLFHHFGDSAENENNTTRAFLIAATRSPWSPMLFRSFLDLLAEQMRANSRELLTDFDKFFRSWPETLQVSLERDISADKFPGDDVAIAILVALTPVSEGSGQVVDLQFPKPTGRVDATLIARQPTETPWTVSRKALPWPSSSRASCTVRLALNNWVAIRGGSKRSRYAQCL